MLTTVASGRVFDYSYCIGMYSQSGLGFWTPQDFVLGEKDRVYVLSRGVEQLGQRISKITLDQEFQGQFGSFGAEDGRFVWPRSIDLDRNGRVFVTDEYLNRISIFDGEGAFRYHWGRSGSGDGELNGPSANFNRISGGKAAATAIWKTRGESASTTKTASTWLTGETTGCRNSRPPESCW